jgi:rhodanese-related sulfurtransferase
MKFSLPFFKSASPSVVVNQGVDGVYDLFNRKSKEYVFIDVRQAGEWREGTIPGSLRISLGELSGHLQKLDKNLNYVLVCRSGNRSGGAAEMMAAAGFTHLVNFQGGMMAWQNRKYPLER